MSGIVSVYRLWIWILRSGQRHAMFFRRRDVSCALLRLSEKPHSSERVEYEVIVSDVSCRSNVAYAICGEISVFTVSVFSVCSDTCSCIHMRLAEIDFPMFFLLVCSLRNSIKWMQVARFRKVFMCTLDGFLFYVCRYYCFRLSLGFLAFIWKTLLRDLRAKIFFAVKTVSSCLLA